jgi:hypothetical protein
MGENRKQDRPMVGRANVEPRCARTTYYGGTEGHRQGLTQLFSGFPMRTDRRHTFVIAGFEVSKDKLRASVWTVSNCLEGNGTMLQSPNSEFDVQKHTVDIHHALLYITGLREAVSRDDRKRLQKKLRASYSVDQIEKIVVDVIKMASSKPKWGRGINDNVLAIRVSPRGEVLATQYPASAGYSRYVPILVWYEAGRDYAAGDALVVSSRKGWRFGPIMYVMPPSSAGLQSKVDFSFRFDNAKHKKDHVGEISIVQEI